MANAKERLKKLGARTAWGKQGGADKEENWSINAPAFYKHDLREQLVVIPASDNILDRRAAAKELREKQEKWQGLVSVQDEWERLRRQAEQSLVESNTKLNPIYFMQEMRKDHKLARTKDYIREEADAKRRVDLIRKKGMEHRVE